MVVKDRVDGVPTIITLSVLARERAQVCAALYAAGRWAGTSNLWRLLWPLVVLTGT